MRIIKGKVRPRTRPVPGTMNKHEEKYAAYLELRKRTGEIIDYRFERLKFKLADKTFYTPDFIVVTPEMFELHEVKGFWEDDARIKIKVAAEEYPYFQFIAVQWKEKQWKFEEF
ncbi:MAG: hypothetical protein BWX55_00159 [Deltaproteobacteria bacterium ADurb.Bin022]|nr:MAG: hypothetical protein BWX55_00159 [Deltaproteobacteria bacterium ADurb.Bin022]